MAVKALARGNEKKYNATKFVDLTNKFALRSPTNPTINKTMQSQNVLSRLKKYALK